MSPAPIANQPPAVFGAEPELELFLSNGDPANPQPEFLGFKINHSGLVITDEEMPFEKWSAGVRSFQLMEGKIGLAKAQYISWGIAKYGKEMCDPFFAQLELPLQDVKRAIDISTLPPGITHANLNDEHYILLARSGLKPKKLADWAKLASIQHLTPGQLKASLREGEVVDQKTADSQNHGLASVHGVNHEFSVWLRRVNGVRGILKMERAAITEIMGELKPMAQLYLQLQSGLAKLKDRPAKKPAKK